MKFNAIAGSVAIIIFIFAMPSFADEIRVIEVNGTGEVRAAPDIAHLSLEVETHAPTAEECSNKNAALAQKVVQHLKDKLAGKGTVETGDYSLNPEYNEPDRVSVRRLPVTPRRTPSRWRPPNCRCWAR